MKTVHTNKGAKQQKNPPAVGHREAVEAAIDAAKSLDSQTWEEAASKSNTVPPWERAVDKKCH